MAAANTDKLMKVGLASATTLDSNYTINDTTVTVASTSGWPSDTGITFAIDIIDSNGEQVPGTYNEYVGTVDTATSITNVDYADGSGDRNYSAGASTRVYIPVSKTRENRIVDWGTVQHNQDGTHRDVTANSISVAENIDVADGKAIRDGNDNELIKFSQTASAVNEITVKNAATGNPARIEATGGDPNIGINFVPKGSGEVQWDGVAASGAWQSWTPTLSGRFNDSKWTKNCKYKQVGKTVICRLALIANSGTPMDGGSAGAIFTLPVTAVAIPGTTEYAVAAYGAIADIGSNTFMATLAWIDTTKMIINSTNASGTPLSVSVALASTVPITWVSGDEIHATFTYEAA